MIRKFLRAVRSKVVGSGNPSAKKPIKKSGTSQQDTGQKKARSVSNKSGKVYSEYSDGSSQSEGKKHRSRRNNRNKNKANSLKQWSIESFNVEEQPGKTRFHDLHLHHDLMHAIHDLGFSYCSPIQAESIPLAFQNKDVTGKAQTGTGKTAAFLIASLQKLLNNPLAERYASEPRVLVIAPTRELVLQIGKDAESLAKHAKLTVQTVVGGMDYQKQQQLLKDQVVDVLIATPGRLLDFIHKEVVFLDQIETLVIDEADRMLDMGFIPDVTRIINHTPPRNRRQTLFFSATYNAEVERLVARWTDNPAFVEIESEAVTTANVDQKVYLVQDSDKFTVLYNIIKADDVTRAIVFANRRDTTRKLSERLSKLGIRCALLSGEVSQQKRIKTLESFRSGKESVLVATDVAGRGLHVDGISHVVNYTLPDDPEDYVHRIGRTGRAGAKGTSISLAGEDDAFLLPELESYIGQKLKLEQVPENFLQKISRR